MKTLTTAICLLFSVEVIAGNLNPSQGDPAGASGIPALQGIYKQLDTGNGVLVPTASPSGYSAVPEVSSKILDDIRGKLPAADNINGATINDVRNGRTFWGLRTDGTWGVRTGQLYGGYTCSGSMNGTRWCDNGDGTIRDMTSGLVWLKETNCSAHLGGVKKTGLLTWDAARTWSSYIRSGFCGLGDGSVMGDWRLPSMVEMASIMRGVDPVRPGTPRLFKHVQPSDYWTNTTDRANESAAWATNHGNGAVHAWLKTSYSYVWLVRSGQ